MILSPCAVAEWGYLLTAEWWEMRALARQQEEQDSTPLHQPVATGFAATKAIHGTAPAAARSSMQSSQAPSNAFAPVRRSRPAVSTAANHDHALRVAERLAALMEIHRLVANGLLDLPLDQAMKLAGESPLLSEPKYVSAPVRRAAPAPPPAATAQTQRVATPPPVQRAMEPSPAQRVAAPPAPPVRRAAPPVPPPVPSAPPAPSASVVRETAPVAATAPPPPPAPALRQPVRSPGPVSAVQPRVPDDIYALYGFDESASDPSQPDPPSTPPHESSGEISVAA